MRKYFLLLTIITLLVSCFNDKSKVKHNNAEFTTILMDPDTSKKIYLSDIVSKLDIKILETSEESMISRIKKLDIDDDYFILNDADGLVYVFDSEGNFKNSVGRKGKGPGELMFPQGFTLDRKNKQVWLVDNYKVINKYDYNGNYTNNEANDIFFTDFMVSDEGLIYYYTSKNHNIYKDNGYFNLWIRNRDSVYTTYFPFDPVLYPNGGLRFDTRIPFNRLSDKISCNYVCCDTIYSIDQDAVSPLYAIDFNTKKADKDMNSLSGEEFLEYMKTNTDKALYVQNFIETESFVRFNYVMSMWLHEAIYDKKSKKVIEGVLINDLFDAPINILTHNNNKLVGSMNMLDLKIQDKASNFIDGKTLDRLRSTSDENNPVIIEIELKEIQ